MNSEQLKSAKKLFFILLGIDIAITVVVGLNAFSTIGTLKDIQSGTREVDQSLLSSFAFWDGFSKLIFLTMIGVGLGLVRWLNSCYRFAKNSLGATGFKNERWTAAGWIIPLFNLFKPYQIINEIYKAGAPTYTTSDGWQKESGSGLLLTWWIFWAVTHFIGTIIGKQLLRGAMRDDVTLQQAIGMTELQAWACVVSVIIAGLWFVVANTLTQRLLARSALPVAKGASEQFVSPISPSIPAMTTTQQTAASALVSNQQQATDTAPGMKTRYIAIATAIAILLASAFPPFQITIRNRIVDLGYSFLFSPPLYRGSSQMIGSVNLGTLFAEYVGILAIGALAWLFATSIPSTLTAGATSGDQPANAKWLRIKAGAAAGIVIVAAIFGWAFIKDAVQMPREMDWAAPNFKPFSVPGAARGGNYFDRFDVGAKPAKEDAAEPDEHRVLILQRELSDRVPGWQQIKETPEFKAWLPAQNAEILAKSESWNVDEAADVFKAFEKHKSDAAKVAQIEKDRQERLRRGKGVQGSSLPSASQTAPATSVRPPISWEQIEASEKYRSMSRTEQHQIREAYIHDFGPIEPSAHTPNMPRHK